MENQTLAVPILSRLRSAVGRYRGEGVNHEGESFKADFMIDEGLDGSLIEIRYRASDAETTFHEERTWICEDLFTGKVGMWTVSTNTPGVMPLTLISDSDDGSYATQLTFQMGEPNDKTRFREQIILGIRHDSCVEYVYSWGVPHQEFGVKSKALLRPV